MVFSSTVFLFAFLPLTLGLYFAAGGRYRNAVLFLVSLIFYAWGEPVYVVLMIVSTALDYTCGRGVDRYRGRPAARAFLLASVIGNLSLLGFFKYAGAVAGAFSSWGVLPLDLSALQSIALPIGISFYTFQTMSYTIDVYRGQAPVQKNFISLGAYVALFPQLIAGPIVRYRDIAEQLNHRTVTAQGFGCGMRRFVLGLGKKIILANSIGLLWNDIQAMEGISAATAWLGMVAYSFQIYFDFSGYSDMAIGLGKLFGFDFPENFNYPYISGSVSEFWRRWHISLGSWFRDYVYFPLGGSRRGMPRTVFNLAVVWLLTGIWHGASLNFVCWGAYFGILIILEKLFLQKLLGRLKSWGKAVSHIYLLLAVLLGWTLFAFEDMGAGLAYLKALFGAAGNSPADGYFLYQLSNYAVLLLVCAFASTPLYRRLLTADRLDRLERRPAGRIVKAAAILAVLFLSTAYLIDSSFNPFLYFRF